MQKFLVNTSGFSKETATLISASALFIYMCLQPVVGAISDRIGRRPVLIAFGVLGTLTTVPILTALAATRDAWTAFALVMAGLVIVSGYSAINAVVKAELFPTHVRALGVGLPFAVTVALFGGTAEYIGLWFKSVGHETSFYWYITVCISSRCWSMRACAIRATHQCILTNAPSESSVGQSRPAMEHRGFFLQSASYNLAFT